MAFTRHGHRIPRSTFTIEFPENQADCGGTRTCKQCQEDVAEYNSNRESRMTQQELDPLTCKAKARKLVSEYIDTRYGSEKAYEVYITSFTDIGLSWKVVLTTTLPNSAFFTVEYYALKQETTLKVYAQTEKVTKFSRGE